MDPEYFTVVLQSGEYVMAPSDAVAPKIKSVQSLNTLLK